MSSECSCHGRCATPEPPSVTGRKIVLSGNPNVGKSVFFGVLTGIYNEVSNYPGTTVEISRGRYRDDLVMDTPGIYGVASFNDEERVARDIILDADIIVNVVDGMHLERDLFLTQQLIDMGKPIVVALNFMDEVEKSDIRLDIGKLSEMLGVTVVPTTAIRRKGLQEVMEAIDHARPGRQDPELVRLLFPSMQEHTGSQAEGLMVMEGDEAVAERLGVRPGKDRERFYLERRNRVNNLTRSVITELKTRPRLSRFLGRAAVNPVTGIPVMGFMLWLMYQVIGVWVAGDIVGFTEETVMQGRYEPWVRKLLAGVVPADSFLDQILTGEFGMLTMTITYLAGLLLPLVLGFYLFLAVLEDSGYLPRLATLVDRVMTFFGLNGRAVIPIILGFGCVQLGTITTRLLGTNREKSIATAILNFTVPCSAQIGVIAGMLAAVGGGLAPLYVAVIFTVLAVLGTVLNKALPGKSSALLIDLPPMRLPRLDNVVRKTLTRSWYFMREATPWFLLGSFIVATLQATGGLQNWQKALTPFTEGWLQIPPEAATAFVMGLVRRDFGAAGLTELAMSPSQVVVSLVVITLFVPCIASLMILFKERGPREATVVWAGSWLVAFLVGGILSQAII